MPGLVHWAILAEDCHFGCGGIRGEAVPQIITAAAGTTIKLLIRQNNPRLLCLVSGGNSQVLGLAQRRPVAAPAASNAWPAWVAMAPGRKSPAVPSPGVAGSANHA